MPIGRGGSATSRKTGFCALVQHRQPVGQACPETGFSRGSKSPEQRRSAWVHWPSGEASPASLWPAQAPSTLVAWEDTEPEGQVPRGLWSRGWKAGGPARWSPFRILAFRLRDSTKPRDSTCAVTRFPCAVTSVSKLLLPTAGEGTQSVT